MHCNSNRRYPCIASVRPFWILDLTPCVAEMGHPFEVNCILTYSDIWYVVLFATSNLVYMRLWCISILQSKSLVILCKVRFLGSKQLWREQDPPGVPLMERNIRQKKSTKTISFADGIRFASISVSGSTIHVWWRSSGTFCFSTPLITMQIEAWQW